MPHKTTSEQLSPGLSNSEKSLYISDSFKVRRTRNSLKSVSPGSRLRIYNNSISIQDLMGGEKKATDIHLGNRLLRSSLVTTNSAESSPTIVNAEDKIHSILQARQTRQRRRSDVCKSLDIASPMNEKHSRKSFSGISDELENITLPLNDATVSPEGPEKEGGRRRRRSSIGSLRRSDVSREHRMRMMKGLENSKAVEKKFNNSGSFLSPFSPKSPCMKRTSSANNLRDRLRKRLQGVNYCDLDESNHSYSDTEVKISPTYYGSGDDDCTADESDEFMESPEKVVKSRSKSQQRSRSKSSKKISRENIDSVEGEVSLKKPRSKSKNRIRSKSKSKQKRRSSRVERTETEDESSSTSLTRRSLRRPKHLEEEASIISDENSDIDCSCEFKSPRSSKSLGYTRSSPKSSHDRKGRRRVSRNLMDTSNSSTESYNVSPGSFKGNKRTKTKRPSLEKTSEDDQSLSGFLLDSECNNRSTHNDDLSHVTEEKSHASNDAQTKFLQFDPTSGNHVRSMDQNQAKKTSESINGLHGMTPNLEIAELSGLPTFEKFVSCDSTSTGTTEESLNSSSHHDPTHFFATIQMSPKKGMYPRSASMVNTMFQTPGGDPFEDGCQNAQWNLGGVDSAHQGRSIGNVGKNMFFNKKGERTSMINTMYPRSASMVNTMSPSFQTPGEDPLKNGCQNAQWNLGGVNSVQQGRSIGNVGKNMFFNKKGERINKPMRRTSDLGVRTSSLGAMMGLRGRYKSRNFGDGESLLRCEG